MHGNVAEWCRDWYQERLPGGVNPELTTEASYRVLRGGSWRGTGRYCRSACRSGRPPDSRYDYDGFRVTLVPTRNELAADPKGLDLFAGIKAGQEQAANSLKMKFCWCPPGEFTMGSPLGEKDRQAIEAQVQVNLTKGFWLGKYEVTQGEWQKLMGTTLRQQADKAVKGVVLNGEGPTYPMYWVSHDEVTEFCRKLTEQERAAKRLTAGWEYRLPTEAQWEYACRAGTKTAYGFGNDPINLGRYAWFRDNSAKMTHPVGNKLANAWGLHDMHGNVWEWCRDWYQETLPGGVNPELTREASDRVLRGGGWGRDGRFCRSAGRGRITPGLRVISSGFRVAAVQSSAEPR